MDFFINYFFHVSSDAKTPPTWMPMAIENGNLTSHVRPNYTESTKLEIVTGPCIERGGVIFLASFDCGCTLCCAV